MDSKKLIVAAIQLVSSNQVRENLNTVEKLVEKAVKQGAGLVVLPENFALMASRSADLLKESEVLGDGEIQQFMTNIASDYNIWLVGGSIPIRSADEKKVFASCLVYDTSGHRVAQYDKLHLYDVDIIETGERYRESDTFVAGNNVVVIETPYGKMGLSICYDLRFPELYRKLTSMGAEFIVAPSAFTESTGKDHWSLLCRARAVENACFIIAPNQGGIHANGRETYGHSMIVDPWGVVLAESTKGPDIAVATLDRPRQNKIRQNFPSIDHGRFTCNLKRK
ncbi:MAG: apolipoprotein acyltransferase [Piscirickettsiaceae bacterium]|nr:MAG: apolipoprotein acyltransferase [Piscirickettsiaceae bacterium]